MGKVFEALSRIEECWYDDPYTDREDNLTYEDDIDTIKQALTTKSKKEQAFDIIKEKNVDIKGLLSCEDYKEYNFKYATLDRQLKECRNYRTLFCNLGRSIKTGEWIGCNKTRLIKPEFDLLKEVL